jgi:hypothetical protein
MTDLSQSNELPVLTDRERLDSYNLILEGCQHLWSKGKMQNDRVQKVLDVLIPLTKNDPYFLAHLTSYVLKKSKQHDLHVLTTYVNALSGADGSAFSPGSKYFKPNLRYISAAAIQMMEPKHAKRVLDMARTKFGVVNYLRETSHFPSFLMTSLEKYIKYREVNIEIMRGIKKAGLGNTMTNFYRALHLNPSDEAAAILRWQQKDHKIEFAKPLFDFTGKSDLEIAEAIRKDKIPVLAAIGALEKVTPVIAVALLEQATGNQAVILRRTFEDAGVLNDPEVAKFYEAKVKTAQTALDRVDKISKEASAAVQKVLKNARSEVRKEQVGDLGKIYMHIDVSGSMNEAIEFAKDKAAIFAECVQNPAQNFGWGVFSDGGMELPKPQEFVHDAFQASLFGFKAGGSTDVFACYPYARAMGAEVDVIVTDGGHNLGPLDAKIRLFHERYPQYPKPKACVIIDFGDPRIVKPAYEVNGIPVAVMKPKSLESSANVAEAVRTAMIGPLAIVNSIMEEPFLELPSWYYTI